MEKHKKLIGIFGGVIAVIVLAYWGYWSLETYHMANRNADIATEKWQKSEDFRRQLSQTIDQRNEALKVVEETETKVKAAEEAKTECDAKVKELETALATKTTATKPPVVPIKPTVPPVKVVSAKEVPEELKLAIVQKGEGIEHALIRQLIFVPELYGFKGDTDNKEAVKKWAQTKAHKIAILAGYVDSKTGNEVRVKGPGGNVAYVLQADSGLKLSVAQSCKDKEGNFPDSGSKLVKTLELAKDFQFATFQGNIDVQPYEYLYFKVKGK